MVGLPEDLFDIEKRPGGGVQLWTYGVEHQLKRVTETNYRHRLNNSFNKEEQRDDPDAERQLHVEVYFLVLAIRRILRFHDLLAEHVADPRLKEALTHFTASNPGIKDLRDMFEHYDEYLLDSPKKHRKFDGRSSPLLVLQWDGDNVVVEFGDLEVDVTLAAIAAIELGKASYQVWDELTEQHKEETREEWPMPDPENPRMVELTITPSTIIGRDGEQQQFTGAFRDMHLRDATPDEIERLRADDSLPASE